MNTAYLTTVPDVVRAMAEEFPDYVHVMFEDGESLTFREMDERSNAMARGFKSHGVRKGDLVFLIFGLENWIDGIVTNLGLQKIGAIAVEAGSDNADPTGLYEETRGMLDIVRDSATLKVVCPADRVSSTYADWIRTPDELEAGQDQSPFEARVRPEDDSEITFTSGTEGAPKAIVRSHQLVTFGSRYEWSHPDFDVGEGRAVYLSAGGKLVFQNYPVREGALPQQYVLMRSFDPERYCALVEKHRAQYSKMSPAKAMMIVDSEAYEFYDMSSMKVIRLDGSRAPTGMLPKLQAAFPHATIFLAYNTTEARIPCGVAVKYNADSPLPSGMLGRPPTALFDSEGRTYPGPQVQVTDEADHVLPPGEIGEIWLRCLGLPQSRYHGDPQLSARVFSKDGWTRTGDLGYLDEKDNLYLTDRKGDNIMRGTSVVSLIELDTVLEEHIAVAEAASFPVIDDTVGEEVAAAVVLRSPVKVKELQRFVRERLAGYKVPRMIYVVPELPRNDRGKVIRTELRERTRQRDNEAEVTVS